MSVSRILGALLAVGATLTLAFWSAALGQGFAGLGTTAEGFTVPSQDIKISLPSDHGSHPNYRIEWWYLTANLKGADGKDYGAQWTLFRSALAPGKQEGWSSPQIWMGHAAVTTENQQFSAERLSRDGIDQAGVVATPFWAWIDDWRMQAPGERREISRMSAINLSQLDVHASGKDFSYDLSLKADGPVVAQGLEGYSVKSPAGQASYYYSQPFYQVDGQINLPDGPVKVTGKAWLDHEWSSQPLASDQTGWDWFSLHLDGGQKLMGFRLRDSGKGFTSATWIAADGTPHPLSPGDLQVTPLEMTEIDGKSIPTSWRVQLPRYKLDVTTDAINPRAWMETSVKYWEGPIHLDGSHRGVGYLEMTGY